MRLSCRRRLQRGRLGWQEERVRQLRQLLVCSSCFGFIEGYGVWFISRDDVEIKVCYGRGREG